MTAANIILACWLVFLAVWAVMAAATKRNLERESRASRVRYSIWLWIAVALLLFHRSEARFTGRVFPENRALHNAGVALAILGVAIMIWARVVLGRNWSGAVTFKEGHELVVAGPYRFVRNPIYTGLLLLFLGTALHQDLWFSMVAVLLAAISLSIKLRQEEEVLQKHFPETFPAYRKRVKSLVPYLF